MQSCAALPSCRGTCVRQRNEAAVKPGILALKPLWRLIPAPIRRHMMHRAVQAGAVRPDAKPPPARAGLAVVGELAAVSGLGESARTMVAALRALRVPVFPVDTDLSGVLSGGERPPAPPKGAPLVIHANPHRLGTALLALPRDAVRGRRIIGYFAWELPVAPSAWRRHLRLVHEIWVPSHFVAGAMATILPKDRDIPVRVVPHEVAAAPMPIVGRGRAAFDLPADAVIVLASFNYASGFARKNPLGAVEAFRRAFGTRQDRLLLLKIVNREAAPDEHIRLRLAIADLPNVVIDDRQFSREDNYAFTAAADIVLSLHRSEGFGLVMAEAMLLGRPVVATAWSGNMDFMDEQSAALVPAALVPPEDPTGTFNLPDAVWADPDLDVAAAHLRRLADDPDARTALGLAGQQMVRQRLNGDSLRQATRDLGLPVGGLAAGGP
jgi:glycosyltransferase involved in cell wall biosynthesis